MSSQPRLPISIRRMTVEDAPAFDILRCAYGAEMGGKPKPDPAFSRSVLEKPFVLGWAAMEGETMVGFLLGFEVPEAVYGTTACALDDMFVTPAARGRLIGKRLIMAAVATGKERGWSHVRWIVPEDDVGAVGIYDLIAERVPWLSYVIRIDRTKSL
jgi:GNAT superfamily N-acetyltransferase